MNTKLTKLELEAVRFACTTIMADGGTAYEAFDKEQNKMINALVRAQDKLIPKIKKKRTSY